MTTRTGKVEADDAKKSGTFWQQISNFFQKFKTDAQKPDREQSQYYGKSPPTVVTVTIKDGNKLDDNGLFGR